MGESGDPPAGTPEGGPDGGEDEYRSVVFDESFVRAARLQEFSARERMTDHARAVRRRPALHRGLSRQALLLVVLIALAFGTAIYMGIRHPYPAPQAKRPQPLRMTVIPLAPQDSVPGSTRVADLYAHSPAARFPAGAEGVGLPAVRRTAHFSNSQVRAALTTAREYLIASSLDPDTLTGGSPGAVRLLLDPAQHGQFDRSFAHPAADERHAPTGWLVRFDRARAALADERARVRGTLRATETDRNALEVTSDHTFVYALRPAAREDGAQASLFTVRRELRFRFDRDDLRTHRAELLVSAAQAGPLSCADETASRLRPLLAGQRAKAGGPAATDPYETGKATAVCGSLAASAQPSP
ncbi:SCO2583 family membrane protein [Streptomyces huasconensis]|uniref:SCO2583 family membrane protein n=1 Tax=Streptomyces huasconensis TaxID=1854574 RepID=UPI0036F9922C